MLVPAISLTESRRLTPQIAVVVVGGTISSALLTLVVLPVSCYGTGAVRAWWIRRRGAIGLVDTGPDGTGGPADEADQTGAGGVTGS